MFALLTEIRGAFLEQSAKSDAYNVSTNGLNFLKII